MADKSLEDFAPEELNAMGQLYAALARDPATREIVLRATKKVSPQTSIPEIDVLDRVAAATKPHLDKIDKLTAEGLEREQKERLREARDSLKESGHDAEEIKAIEQLMLDQKKEGNLLTHKTAAEFFRLQKQTAQPVPSSIRVNTLPVDKKTVKEAGGIKRWGAIEAGKAIDDMRAGRVKLH